MKSLLAYFTFCCAFLSAMNAAALSDISVKTIEGQDQSLATYSGKVLLIVNVASKCGYTRQYDGLEKIAAKYREQGLVVLGFPCNQFGGQEPGTNAEIKEFCSTKFKVSFPLFDKIDVNGAGRHPLYSFLSGEASPFPGKISWNFNKFLVGRDGKILARYESSVTPESDKLTSAVEAALAAK
jgi:glutathione peroxidase